MANLFARVAIKNGDHAGEVTVQSEPTGEILHPRRGIPMPATPLDGKECPPKQDRRRFFADWLTSPDNPFFARALVNRVWTICGTRVGLGGRRFAANQSADQRRILGCARQRISPTDTMSNN